MDENTDSNYVRDSTVIDDTIYGLINEAFEMERKTNDPKYRNSIFKENMEYFVKTDDGSYSIKSREINHKVETLHTSTGAISESFEKFIKPLKLDYGDDIAILDICAGLGYNTSAAVDDFLKNSRGNASLQVDMLEISKPTLAAGLLVPSPIEAHDITNSTSMMQDVSYKILRMTSMMRYFLIPSHKTWRLNWCHWTFSMNSDG